MNSQSLSMGKVYRMRNVKLVMGRTEVKCYKKALGERLYTIIKVELKYG
jgi:hypothetical protein